MKFADEVLLPDFYQVNSLGSRAYQRSKTVSE